MSAIVGRDSPLATIYEFVEDDSQGLAALLLEGRPGIGKSTLFQAGVERALGTGRRVISSRPAEAERSLAYAGLGDLLEDALEDVLPRLAPPRRRALDVALLRLESGGDRVDRRAVAVAVRDVLAELSLHDPLLVAIDDVQWLDPSSAAALAFAIRRLPEARLRLLVARRSGGRERPSALEDALSEVPVRRLTVGALSAGALHQLLRDRLNKLFPRQTLLRIHERSGGNPFYALELARVVDPASDPFAPLAVPSTLEDLLGARIATLPAATRHGLELAAALGTASAALLEKARIPSTVLAPAVAAGVIEPTAGGIQFSHPLLASLLYGGLGDRRATVHARIAELVDDRVVRARHLALARNDPDPGVARELDAAVSVALDRGASAIAAELAEHAHRLTPRSLGDERSRRALAAARAHEAAGEWTRAVALARELLAETVDAAWRAEALMLLSELEGVDRAAELLEEALVVAADHAALRSTIHCRLAWATRFRTGVDHARAAMELAENLDDDALRAHARSVQSILGWFHGEPVPAADLLALARDLPTVVGGQRLVQEATQAIVNTFAPQSTQSQARAFFEHEYREWLDRDECRAARALWGMAWLDFWAGEWRAAADHAERAHDISIQYGLEVPQDHLPIAVIAVHRGQLDVARRHSERALDLAVEQFGSHPPQHLAVMGLIAAGEGDVTGAVEWLERANERAAALAWGEPSVRWWVADHAELMLEEGRIEPAVRLVDAWEADAVRVQRQRVLADVSRCRGLIEAATGDVDAALSRLERAAAEHEAAGDPFGRARALLALGTLRRRSRQKRPATAALEAALSEFEAIGAEAWTRRARAELGRIGGRHREEGLTAAEMRVAELAASGRTNREAAASLFLAERTVASHLSSVYAKLGVRSRTELARRLHVTER